MVNVKNQTENLEIQAEDLIWIRKMIAGPENIDGLDWVEEDELIGEELTDFEQFGVTMSKLENYKRLCE